MQFLYYINGGVMIWELKAIYTTRKSFYKKAYVVEVENESPYIWTYKLYSYNTHVATYQRVYMEDLNDKISFYITHNKNYLTSTTLRHIKEFMQQLGLNYTNKQDLLKHYEDLN